MDLSALQKLAGERAPQSFCEVMQSNPSRIVHIDGDYLAYFASGSDKCEPGEARRNVLSRCDKVKAISGAGRVIVHLTHGGSTKGERFLAAVTQPYQGQRKAGKKPKNWEFLRSWMETYDGPAFEPKLWLSREADDGIAYVNESAAKHQKLLHVVHTKDKDMQMFCGIHLSWDDYTITEVPLGAYEVHGKDGKLYGHKWFWMQMLTGDTADNIPGLRGVGPGIAEDLLRGTASNADAAPIVFGAYSAVQGEGWRDYFAEQAVLLWMRTDRDAKVLDVLQLGVFGPALIAAFERLDQRVKERRAELDALYA